MAAGSTKKQTGASRHRHAKRLVAKLALGPHHHAAVGALDQLVRLMPRHDEVYDVVQQTEHGRALLAGFLLSTEGRVVHQAVEALVRFEEATQQRAGPANPSARTITSDAAASVACALVF